MSQLKIRTTKGEEFKLNVTQFRSPMSASISSAQTKTMLQHFPIRAGQPDINFTVQFRSNDDKHTFQSFVRDHQINAQSAGESGKVTLWWPERNIENWAGFIVEFRVVEARFVYAPRVTFGVALTESLMSTRAVISSSAASWRSILGPQIGPYTGAGPLDVDYNLIPPSNPTSNGNGAVSTSGQTVGSNTINQPGSVS